MITQMSYIQEDNYIWQCTEWQETDELVDCEEITITTKNSHTKNANCELIYGEGWKNSGNFVAYNIGFLVLDMTTGETVSNGSKTGFESWEDCVKTEIKCEHKKVCTQETLVRNLK